MENTVIKLMNRPLRDDISNCFSVEQTEARAPRDGEIQVRTEYVSIDPAMRTWIEDYPSYLPPVPLGQVMRAITVGEVIQSNNPDFAAGDKVLGMHGAQSVYTGPGLMLSKLDCSVVPTNEWLGGLGGTGMIAYNSLIHAGKMKDGDVVVVSAAAGAVGHVAIQIAKLKGNPVIGIAGGPEKCKRVVEEFGADACIDYKSEDVEARLGELCPNGIDVYLDNVGGKTLEAVLDHIALRARIIINGAIGDYHDLHGMSGPGNYLNLIGKGASMTGILNSHWAEFAEQAQADMLAWRKAGDIKFLEQVETGIENFADVLAMQFAGKNTGKLLLKV